jgi:hypothetical protein
MTTAIKERSEPVRVRYHRRSDVVAAMLGVFAVLALLSAWAVQQLLSGPGDCAMISDPAARLACFDQASRLDTPARGETAPVR